MSQAVQAPPLSGGALPAASEREAWLFRRVMPNPHPLQDLIRQCQGNPHLRIGAGPRAHPDAPCARTPTQAPPAPPIDPAQLLSDEAIARRVHDLPPLPRAMTEALRVVRSDALSADLCVRAIEQDAALAARLLCLANSPFYGACGRVSSVGDAVRLLGLRTVAGVVVAVSMRSMLAQWPDGDGQFPSYWVHAVATATAARELARAAGADPDQAFLAGLLHDLGRLVSAVFSPAQTRLARAKAQAKDIDLREAEAQLIGRAHDDVGAAVARHWKLPDNIVSAIALHHAPRTTREAGVVPLETIVHVADAIVHALDLVGDGAEMVPSINDDAWRLVCASDSAMLQLFERVQAGVTLLAADH